MAIRLQLFDVTGRVDAPVLPGMRMTSSVDLFDWVILVACVKRGGRISRFQDVEESE